MHRMLHLQSSVNLCIYWLCRAIFFLSFFLVRVHLLEHTCTIKIMCVTKINELITSSNSKRIVLDKLILYQILGHNSSMDIFAIELNSTMWLNLDHLVDGWCTNCSEGASLRCKFIPPNVGKLYCSSNNSEESLVFESSIFFFYLAFFIWSTS